MLQHVYERACRCSSLDEVVIATDDEAIAAACRTFGAPVRMTASTHLSGTDRVAEVAAGYPQEIVVNIQGDEPLIDPGAIAVAVESLLENPEAQMATLKRRIERLDEITNPNVVKVVTDRRGFALYFSRSPIPFNRGGAVDYFKHIGLYVYRREFLLGYSGLPVGPLEQAERLEQLRALENGFAIHVAETEYESLGVDTPEDLVRVQRHLGTLS